MVRSMFKRLRRHPFPVVARFERVVAVSFAFPEEILRPLVPSGLEIDTHEGLGFVTVALVWTKNLRPAGFPALSRSGSGCGRCPIEERSLSRVHKRSNREGPQP